MYLLRLYRMPPGTVDDCFVSHIRILNISEPTNEDHERQIKQLQQKLSQNEDERSLLRERLNEVEVEFRQAIDDRASTIAMYEEQLQSLVQERNALVEQQELQAGDR